MKKTNIKKLMSAQALKEYIIKEIKNLKEQGCQMMGCTNPTAVNYNPFISPNCDDGSCLTSQTLASAMGLDNFYNQISTLGCQGLQKRHNHLNNKLGVVSTPGASLPGQGNWMNYDFDSDNIGAGSQGTGHSNWQSQLHSKIFIIGSLMGENNC